MPTPPSPSAGRDYASLGTVELLLDGTTGTFVFLEANSRLRSSTP
jgi:biotin carboxylase